MLTLLKNTFTSKSELLKFLRDLKAEINLSKEIYESLNNASVSKTKEQLNIEKDLKTYFKNNKNNIDKKWLKIIRDDSKSYTVKQAIHLIFCRFTEQGLICYTDEQKLTELENYANGNIKTLLDFIDNLNNESDYVEMFQPENIYEDQNSIQLRGYFVNDKNKNINKINMNFFNKIKQFVKSNDENTTTSQGPYEIDNYSTINTNNNSNKSTFDEIVETLFSCDIKKNNKTTMKCKIEIDMIKKLKEYTKNIKKLVEFLSELLENAGTNTNEFPSLEKIRLPENQNTSYMSESSNLVKQRFGVFKNSDYAHLQKNPGTKTHKKSNNYSQLNRGNTVYTEPNSITNDNDTYANVLPLATLKSTGVVNSNNPKFIKHYNPLHVPVVFPKPYPRTSTSTRKSPLSSSNPLASIRSH